MRTAVSCEPPMRPGRGLLHEAIQEALRTVLRNYARLAILEIGLGRRFLYIHAENDVLGLAFAPQTEPLPAWLVEGNHTLEEVASLAWSHPLLSSAALAAVNAATAALIDEHGIDAVDARHGVDVGAVIAATWPKARTAIVGYVPGVAQALRKHGLSITVYEDNEHHRREAESDGFQVFPGRQLIADIDNYELVVATGASLLDPLVVTATQMAGTGLAIVGPTSSFHPAVAARLGASVLGGSYVPPEKREKVLRLVKAGQGFRRIRGYVAKWTWWRRG